MIRIGALFPQHLNLNGDLGNLEVLARQLQWRGLGCEILPIETVQSLSDNLNLVFVGHGSTAAWAAIREPFRAMAPVLKSLLTAGTPGLSVSTGFEQLVDNQVFSNLALAQSPERSSKFVIHEDGANKVLGYLNTDSTLPALHRELNWVGTMLHGPILAKNSELLQELLTSITAHAGLELPPTQASEKAGQLADLIAEIWKLESELASE